MKGKVGVSGCKIFDGEDLSTLLLLKLQRQAIEKDYNNYNKWTGSNSK
jgi:hypothetical protein